MLSSTRASNLDAFAADFLRDIRHHREVRSERLAEAFRERTHIPPFPSVEDLKDACQQLGIPIWLLPEHVPDVRGMNFAHGSNVHIGIQRGLRQALAETTIAHEIREAIENAFQRVCPAYDGLPTHDNRQMNKVSDRFAGYLLMQTGAARGLMQEVGFDSTEFTRVTGRSLPSVLKRKQQLFSSTSGVEAPHLGAWLFECPWGLVESREATVSDLVVRESVVIGGMSQRKGSLAGRVLPTLGAIAGEFDLVATAIERERTCSLTLQGMALHSSMDYLVIAEPITPWGVPWRVLVTAIRLDAIEQVRPLMSRTSPLYLGERAQAL